MDSKKRLLGAVRLPCAYLPATEIQRAYLESYKLQHYHPVIMHPANFRMLDKNVSPVYYSLQCPNANELSPQSRKRSNLITDLYEIHSLLNKYLLCIAENKFNIEGTFLSQLS